MAIRIGSSCALSVPMSLGYVTETRILTDGSTKWQEVCKYAIANKQFLILTPCINDGMGKVHMPSDNDWKTIIDNACKYLRSIGGNINNCKISIINEPTKFFRDNGGKERYAHFINLAYPIVKSYGFRTGAGNMEFRDAAILGNWYGHICANSQFNDLDIHIQGSCDNEQRTKEYTDFALGLATQYKKKLDCTESFYGDITTSSGWNLLNIQLKHAERIGCENFCNVFNNLDTSVFKVDTKPWYKLCFKINGVINSNYWGHWKILMDTSHPIPNIIELERSVDGMIIKTIGFNDTDSKSGYVVLLVNELLYKNGFLNADKVGYSYTDYTKNAAIAFIDFIRENYPDDPVKQLLKSDGRIGRQTIRYLIEEIHDEFEREKYQFALEVMASPITIEGAGV